MPSGKVCCPLALLVKNEICIVESVAFAEIPVAASDIPV